MPNDAQAVWLAAGLRTPFVNVDGPFAGRDSLGLSVPVVQAMARQVNGSIDFAVRGSVVVNLAYANLAREVWLDSKLDPHVPTFTTIMQCSTSMVGVFEAAGMLGDRRAALAMVGGVESMSRVQIGLWTEFVRLAPPHVSSPRCGRSPSYPSPAPPLRHPAVCAGSEEPGDRPQHGRTHRGYGEGLEHQPPRAG